LFLFSSVVNLPPNLIPHNGEAYLFPAFLPKPEADKYLTDLLVNIPWKHQAIKIFGRQVLQPRLTAWFADDLSSYRYSGLTVIADPWNDDLLRLRNKIREFTGIYFNSALLNLYRDGADSVGWHRDNEKVLGEEPVIAALSLGGMRSFLFRNYINKSEKIKITLASGSLLLMKGDLQQHWEHALPKSASQMDKRINITFRQVKNRPDIRPQLPDLA
jgi:alkylated DNA repair dioxygenase AlkB